MPGPRSTRTLEILALALGLVSSSCLVVAALLAFPNAREAGWSRLNELVSGARESVRTSWAAFSRVSNASCPAAVSPLFSWSREDADLVDRTRVAPHEDPKEDPQRYRVFDALFEESRNAELARHDLEEALTLAEEASAKDAPRSGRAAARLRAIQLALALGKQATALTHARAALQELDPAVTMQGTSTVVLSTLAALPSVPADERVGFAEPLVDAWARDELTFPDESARLVELAGDGTTSFDVVEPHVELALQERLASLCTFPSAWKESFAAHARRRALRALKGRVGLLPSDPSVGAAQWSFVDAGGALLAVHAEREDWMAAVLVDRAKLQALFERELDATHALPEGFTLDLDGSHADLGDPVGMPIELSPGLASATLRHPDVAGVLRRGESRTLWLRSGLLVLAVFVAGAALATHFALRRQRRLAEARSAFVAGVSHELRTPLASILLMAENLENGRAGPNAGRYHALIRREALRLRRLVDDVLDFSRLERGKRFEARLESVDCAGWFESLCEEARNLGANAGVEVRAAHEPLPASVTFDGEAVRRAVLNIVVNALQHSGSPVVELEARTESDGVLLVSVADRGKGIPPGERESVFEPFERLPASETVPGAGLGLAIVREIATAHGGSVRVRDPAHGPGALFELRVPLGLGGKTGSPPASAPLSPTEGIAP